MLSSSAALSKASPRQIREEITYEALEKLGEALEQVEVRHSAPSNLPAKLLDVTSFATEQAKRTIPSDTFLPIENYSLIDTAYRDDIGFFCSDSGDTVSMLSEFNELHGKSIGTELRLYYLLDSKSSRLWVVLAAEEDGALRRGDWEVQGTSQIEPPEQGWKDPVSTKKVKSSPPAIDLSDEPLPRPPKAAKRASPRREKQETKPIESTKPSPPPEVEPAVRIPSQLKELLSGENHRETRAETLAELLAAEKYESPEKAVSSLKRFEREVQELSLVAIGEITITPDDIPPKLIVRAFHHAQHGENDLGVEQAVRTFFLKMNGYG